MPNPRSNSFMGLDLSTVPADSRAVESPRRVAGCGREPAVVAGLHAGRLHTHGPRRPSCGSCRARSVLHRVRRSAALKKTKSPCRGTDGGYVSPQRRLIELVASQREVSVPGAQRTQIEAQNGYVGRSWHNPRQGPVEQHVPHRYPWWAVVITLICEAAVRLPAVVRPNRAGEDELAIDQNSVSGI